MLRQKMLEMSNPVLHVYTTDCVNLHSQLELAGRLVPADEILTKMRLGFLDLGCLR